MTMSEEHFPRRTPRFSDKLREIAARRLGVTVEEFRQMTMPEIRRRAEQIRKDEGRE